MLFVVSRASRFIQFWKSLGVFTSPSRICRIWREAASLSSFVEASEYQDSLGVHITFGKAANVLANAPEGAKL